MKILAIEKEVGGVMPGQFAPYLKSEALRVWELYQTGLIREMYFREDRALAVLIIESDDIAAASEALNTLPLVREGLIAFDLLPLVAYPGFARLFA
jgi:hypothetical protein